MAFQPSFNSRVLVGALNLSCEARDVSVDFSVNPLEVSTLCDTARAYIPGRTDASFSASGPLDVSTTTGEPYDLLTDFVDAEKPLTYAPRGLTALYEAMLFPAINTNLSVTSPHDGTVDYSLSAQSTGFDFGFMLEDLTAITADGNGTARDLTAQTTNGAVAHLHVTAFTGLTSNVVTIEDSSDGSTGWATIGTFTTVTGLTSQRLVIAGTVKRYLRVVDNVTGTGSCTRSVAFARR